MKETTITGNGAPALTPFVPRLLRTWLADDPHQRHRVVDGSLAFIDISGFTELTERLAAQGRIGAEELTDILDRLFAELLEVARHDGAHLVKWGGDAVLLLFDGADAADHPARAARAAFRMRARLQRFARVRTPAGRVHLQMSAGIHSGRLTFFLVGDPAVHRELIVCGPAATRTAQTEAAANPGEIGLSGETAALLPAACVDTSGPLALLTAQPPLADLDTDLDTDRDSAGTDPELAQALPPPVRDYLLDGEASAEHRKVTVAFVRLSGTDGLLTRDGPEQVAVALDECVRVVQNAAARHGITFLESDIDQDGSKIMLVSGAPRSGGQDEDRLLQAAWQIVSAPTTLGVRVGVSRGAVFTGVLGPDFCRTYSVKGDAVNLAARIAAQARPGQAVCTTDTLAHARSHYRHERIGPLVLKGKAAPVEAAQLGPELDSAADGADESDGATTVGALVGRDVELSVLRSALREAADGSGALVEIVGEPGIGKSHLLHATLSESDIRKIVISCDEYETNTPYWPLRSLFGRVLGLAPGIHDSQVLRAAVGSIDPGLEPWLPLIGRILDIDVAPTPEVEALSDQFRQTRLREVAAELLNVALPDPVVLAFEDVHLMDDASAGALERITQEIQSRPWLVVVTRREVAEGFRPSGAALVTVRPAPLDQASAAALAQAIGATEALPATVIEALAARAGGNPLFLLGLVRAVRDGADVDTLPDTVEALITSELDRLPSRERTVLRYASVLGMRFDRPQLEALIGDRDLPAPDALRRLAYFVHTEGESLTFAHQLVRDTAYEALPYRLRKSLHGIAGDLLESREAEPDDIAEVLSLHFAQGDRAAKAWHYARIGGERAAAKFAYVQAEELYARAVHVARDLPDVAADDLVDANVSLADARFRIGRQREALESYRHARQSIAGDDPARAALLLRSEALVEYRSGRHSVGLGKLTKGMHLLDAAGRASDPAITLAARSRLEESYAVIRQAQGKYRDALRWARRADHDAEESQDPGARAEALQAVLSALAMLGDDIPIALAEEAIWLYERVGDRAGQSRATNNLAMLRWLDGQGPQALSTFEEAEKLAADAGDTVKAAVARYNIGDVLLRMGRVDEARELLAGLLPVLRAVGLEDYAATATRALGAAIALAGRPDDGTALLHRARGWLDDLGEPAEALETDAALAWTMLEHGDATGAAALAERAARRADDLDAGQLLPWLLRLQGAALSDLGELDEAHRLLQRALDLAKTRSRVERGFVLAELSTVARRRSADVAAAELADRAEAAFADLGFIGSRRYPRRVTTP